MTRLRRAAAWLIGLCVLGVGPAWSQDWSVVAAKVRDSIVPVLSLGVNHEHPTLICTGVVVAPLRVVTEAHCLIRDGREWPVWIGHLPGRVIKNQNEVLLVALDEVPTGWRPLRVADRRPKMGEPVAAFGYAYGVPTHTMTIGIVATDTTPAIKGHADDELWFNIEMIGGMSGGPIVNQRAELVSLNRGTRSDMWGSANAIAYGAGWSSLYRLISLWR